MGTMCNFVMISRLSTKEQTFIHTRSVFWTVSGSGSVFIASYHIPVSFFYKVELDISVSFIHDITAGVICHLAYWLYVAI